ncbi:hypothetical protein CAter10_1186 [Collimonas arenae]|nr:hypothetical protein CAter10_1186 [Collimonas arenae]
MPVIVSNMDPRSFTPWLQHILPAVLVSGLFALVYLVLAPFLASVAWAGVLAYITWPIYLRIHVWMGGRRSFSALLATICMGVSLVLPLLWLIVMVEKDLVVEYNTFQAYLKQSEHPIPGAITYFPWIGEYLQNWLEKHLADPVQLEQYLAQWLAQGAHQLLILFGGIGRNIAKLAFAMMTLFFFYRDGETVLHQIRGVLRSLVGERVDAYMSAAGHMSRAILLSVIVAAIVQGVIAAIGYWVVGIEAAALLGIATALASVIPLFGTALIWIPLSIGLLLNGHLWPGLGLIAWGILLIHPADNLIRPLLISNATKIPILFVMFGVLGGLAAFGLVGLFLGPVILAVAIAVWGEWIKSIDPA